MQHSESRKYSQFVKRVRTSLVGGMLFIAFVGAFVLQSGCAFDFFASFDISASNSVFNAVGGAGAHLFAPAQATAPGSGYWCSAPNRADEVLSKFPAFVRR
jgi:Fe2+ transport system protein B